MRSPSHYLSNSLQIHIMHHVFHPSLSSRWQFCLFFLEIKTIIELHHLRQRVILSALVSKTFSRKLFFFVTITIISSPGDSDPRIFKLDVILLQYLLNKNYYNSLLIYFLSLLYFIFSYLPMFPKILTYYYTSCYPSQLSKIVSICS